MKDEWSAEGRYSVEDESRHFILHPSAFLSRLFESGVLFDELLLAEAGEAHQELGGVADAFAAQHEAAAVLRVLDVRAGREAAGGGRRRGGGRTSRARGARGRRRRGRRLAPLVRVRVAAYLVAALAEELGDGVGAVVGLALEASLGLRRLAAQDARRV